MILSILQFTNEAQPGDNPWLLLAKFAILILLIVWAARRVA